MVSSNKKFAYFLVTYFDMLSMPHFWFANYTVILLPYLLVILDVSCKVQAIIRTKDHKLIETLISRWVQAVFVRMPGKET